MRKRSMLLALAEGLACLILADTQVLRGYMVAQAMSSATNATTETAPTPSPTWLPTPQGAVGPFNFPANVNPLTGLVIDDPAILKHRPLAVKISNAPPL